MKGIIWRLSRLESQDVHKSSRPRNIAKVAEFKKEKRCYQNVIGVWLCIELGDKDEFLYPVMNKLSELNKIFYGNIKKIVVVPFGHMSRNLERPERAKEILEKFKNLLIKNGYEAERLSFGTQKRFLFEISGHPADGNYFEI